MRIPIRKTVMLATAGVVAVLALGTCNDYIELENGLAGFRVTAQAVGVTGGDGSSSDPYDLPSDEIEITFQAEAYDQRGQPLPADYEPVSLSRLFVKPGQSQELLEIELSDSKFSGSVKVRKVFGRVNLWIENVETINTDRLDGAIGPLQLTTEIGTWATGVSNTIHFDNPTLAELQHDQWIEDEANTDTSALPDHFVEFDCRADDPAGPFDDGHGQLVVTGIVNEGFYVTDVAAEGDDYNHLYAYNYSYPENLEIGDRLDRLVGTSQDFSGCTQISFPAWQKATDENYDAEPFRVEDLDALIPPQAVTTAICEIKNTGANSHLCGHSKYNWTIEAMESARVRIENARAPDVFVNCDFNGDLSIVPDWLDSSDPEAICSVACLKHDGEDEFVVQEIVASPGAMQDIVVSSSVVCPWEADIPGIEPHCKRVKIPPGHICSELTTMRQFGQWVVALDDGAGPLINVISRESLVEYDPAASENLGRTIEYLQGNLRQVRAARPRWMILAGRLPGDSPPSMKP